jgi:predicted O-methyltransferase YrrM
VYSKFQLAYKYLHYFITASNGKGHGIHSPFVFDFIARVLNDKTAYPEFEKIEALRKQLLQNNSLPEVEDFGAGSSVSRSGRRTISSIAKNVAKSKKFGQLLFRMVKYYKPSTVLELGTSLGITSSYLSLANPDGKMITMEGAKQIASVANHNFNELNLQNIELIEGNFDDTLSSVVSGLSSVDFAFIDGNHRREPTERYFSLLKEKASDDSIFVFDDIHWSGEMEAAWKNIKADSSVTSSINLFFIGIIFFRKEFKQKQHFVIRF